jgi:hypothetical protein
MCSKLDAAAVAPELDVCILHLALEMASGMFAFSIREVDLQAGLTFCRR